MNNIELIKSLRNTTHASMTDCKNALEEANNDFEKAVDLLKIRGQVIAEKHASKVADEGLVFVLQKDNSYTLVEVNCQTDFVARTSDFVDFAKKCADFFNDNESSNIDYIRSLEKDMSMKTGEKVVFSRFAKMKSDDNHSVGFYVHNNKVASMVKIAGRNNSFLERACLHVVASKPLYLKPELIDQKDLERQKSIFLEQVKDKAQDKIAMIVEGKMNKWKKEVCFVLQPLLSDDPKSSITVDKEAAMAGVEVVGFVRFEVGEMVRGESDAK